LALTSQPLLIKKNTITPKYMTHFIHLYSIIWQVKLIFNGLFDQLHTTP